MTTSLYTAHATTVAGREGHGKTDDGKLSLDLSKPGGNGKGTNPEQLFAIGYGACFGGAVDAVAKKEGVSPKEVRVDSSVELLKDDEGGFFLKVELDVTLDGVDDKTAAGIVEKAHQVCPYSKATRGNIEVVLKSSGRTLASAA